MLCHFWKASMSEAPVCIRCGAIANEQISNGLCLNYFKEQESFDSLVSDEDSNEFGKEY
jgi:hypothetical protein